MVDILSMMTRREHNMDEWNQDISILQNIKETGTDEEKIKAFEWMLKEKEIPKPEPLTRDEERELRMKTRIPFPNKLINP